MSRQNTAAKTQTPAATPPSPGSVLPPRYTPRVAGYTRGPFLTPIQVTPSEWKWRNTRTAVVRHTDGHDYRAIRVFVRHEFIGWWAVELLGIPLPLKEWDATTNNLEN